MLGNTHTDLRTETVLHGIGDALAIRQGNWKYIPATTKESASGIGSGANASDARFAASNISEPMLFNLTTDPNEQCNIFAMHPDKASELARQLEFIIAKSNPKKPSAATR